MGNLDGMIPSGSRILFLGDSITDCGRDKSADGGADSSAIGTVYASGYAALVTARLLADRPADGLECRNVGISGNRIVDVAARAQEHVWNLRPDLLSILIGVNDTWHHFRRGAGVDHVRFERTYRHFLDDTRARFPQLRLVLAEPFVLPCGLVGQGWREDLDVRRGIVAELARKHGAVFLPWQTMFDDACRRAPATHWAPDGVHPSLAGHQLMADSWLKAVG